MLKSGSISYHDNMEAEMESRASALKNISGIGEVLLQENMSRHTSFRVGGPAALFATVNTVEALGSALKILEHAPVFMLGNGSNLLVSDRGYDGFVLKLGADFRDIGLLESEDENKTGNRIYAGAGATMAAVAAFALGHSLKGFEFAGGIPGTLGGGLVMNAGAYGGELSNVVEYADVMDINGNLHRLSNKELKLGYRTSIFKENDGRYIIIGASLVLEEGNASDISAKMEEYAVLRRTKQPLEYPSAGSTFKRPEGMFAGKLISDAGLKGYSVGGAQVSEKHAGFVINTGNASAGDIFRLISKVREEVNNKFGVLLEPEVIMLGDFE